MIYSAQAPSFLLYTIINPQILRGEKDEDDLLQNVGVLGDEILRGLEGDWSGQFDGKPVNSGGYGRESDRFEAVFLGEVERIAITRGEQFRLVVIAVAPDRADCVNHMFRRQVVTFRYLRPACFASAECGAFGKEPRAGSTMYRAVYSPAAEQCHIRGVDDGVDRQRRDVTLK